MKSIPVTVRLSPEEFSMLESLRLSPVRGDTNYSETIRLLIRERHARNKHGQIPAVADYQTDFRNGRPKETV